MRDDKYHILGEDTIIVPVRVLKMLSTEGYFAEWWRVLSEQECNHREAWEICESTLSSYELPGKYENYESFKRAKNYHKDGAVTVITFW